MADCTHNRLFELILGTSIYYGPDSHQVVVLPDK